MIGVVYRSDQENGISNAVTDKRGPLRVKSRGDGPAVVLLHGLFGNADTLGGIGRYLAGDWSVHALDLPGHGESFVDAPLTFSNMANAVAETLAAQEIDKAHFVGHSLGGKVVMQLAALYPEKLRSACILDIAPVDYGHGHQDVFAAVNSVELEQFDSRGAVSDAMAKHITDTGVRQFILTNLRRDENGQYYWRIDFDALQRDYEHLSVAPVLGARFEKPVLVLRGSESSYVLAEHETAFRQRFADCQFKSIDGASHWLHAEKPELINTLIGRFLTQLQ